MSLLEQVGTFTDDRGQIISSTDLAALRSNCALVDQLTYRRTASFDSSSAFFDGTPGFYYGSGDGQQRWRIWKGAIRWQTGVTTLNVNGYAKRSAGGSEVLRIYVDGVSVGTVTPNVSGAAFSFTTSATGYADGQIVTIEIRLTGSSWSETGDYRIYGIYYTPITYAPSWPGVPSFSGQYTAAKLNQLVEATNWLYGRMAAVPMVANLAIMHQLGPYRLNGNIVPGFGSPMYYGSVLRGYTEDDVTISVYLVNPRTPGTRYKILLNGSLVATGPTWGTGVWSDAVVVDLSGVSVGSRAEISIFAEVVTENAAGSPESFNYWSFAVIRSQPDYAGGVTYPYASLNSTPAGDSTVSASTLDSFLNSLSTALSNAKSRIDANSAIFGRSYAMRWAYSPRDRSANVELEQHRARPRLVRLSDRLIVSGKNVKLGFGAISVPVEDADTHYGEYVHQFEETVIDGNTDATKVVYLDSIKGLFPGTAYFGTGTCKYLAEIL